MQQQQTLTTAPAFTNIDDLAEILRYYNLTYQPVDQYYLQVGEITQVQGWILHISVVKPQLIKLLNVIIPELVQEGVPFKIVQNMGIASALLDGSLNYGLFAKIVRIYPENETKAVILAEKLIRLTTSFRGPEIPTDVHLGGTVYTRYGSFNAVIKPDAIGQPERYIYDHQRTLVKDNYHIPFKIPPGITWPFEDITPMNPGKVNGYLSVLNGTYVVTSVIKADAKGSVFKALRMKGLGFQWCLIKEGKHDVAIDEAGRDVQDRLQWQYNLQKDLQAELPVPKAYDLFKENGNTYFVMEFVKGTFLRQVIKDAYQDGNWMDMPLSKKLLLLDYLLQIIDQLEKLHQKGYVHRDFTPVNFILDRHKRLVMIDMELSYSLHEEYPYPPFMWGTMGFMSPEQLDVHTPTVKEDIYGLGATMITLFTNLYPERFSTVHTQQLEANLLFFTGSESIARLIAHCLQHNAQARPELSHIKSVIQHYRAALVTEPAGSAKGRYKPGADQVKKVLHDSLMALKSTLLARQENLWQSNLMESEQFIENPQNGQAYYMGLHTGISGPLYTLALAQQAGLDLTALLPVYKRNYDYLQLAFLSALPNLPQGLYHGAAGMALALAEGLRSGLLEDSPALNTTLHTCLQLPPNGADLATGIAGQGLAMLQCSPYVKEATAQAFLQSHVTALLNSQQPDGAWINYNEKRTGLSHGMAGIIFFLLEYYKQFADEPVKRALEKGLDHLCRKAIKQKNQVLWNISDKNKTADVWPYEGSAGIALCLIHAYKIFENPVYKQLAEGALQFHQPHAIYSNLTLAVGMSGLGNIYLEAAKVFKHEVWQERADWVAGSLLHTAYYQEDGSCYWTVENNRMPTADLLMSNSGIMHFLLRYSTHYK